MRTRERKTTKLGLEPVVRPLADFRPTSTSWLWPGRIAGGKFTLMVGDPGQGKSLVALDMTARISRGGNWPEGSSCGPPGSVLLLNAEDNVVDTVIPRLTALGADLSRVQIMEAVRTSDGQHEEFFSLARHLEQLEWALVAMENPRMVVIDPISSFMRGLNSHSNEAARRMLARLGRLAEQWNVAVLAVTHFAKTDFHYTLRGALGSTAFVAAARAVWYVTQDPLETSRHLLLQLKNNLCEETAGLAFRVSSSEMALAPAIHWEERPVLLTAEEVAKLVRARRRDSGKPRPKTLREEAGECLRELMADGPRTSNGLLGEAMNQGFSEKTLRRALRDIGAIPHRSEGGPYYYTLPGQEVVLPEEPMDAWLELEKREKNRGLLA